MALGIFIVGVLLFGTGVFIGYHWGKAEGTHNGRG